MAPVQSAQITNEHRQVQFAEQTNVMKERFRNSMAPVLTVPLMPDPKMVAESVHLMIVLQMKRSYRTAPVRIVVSISMCLQIKRHACKINAQSLKLLRRAVSARSAMITTEPMRQEENAPRQLVMIDT